MHFVSFQYALLLLTTWVAYWLLPWRRARTALLLAASYTFYMSWNPRLIVLILISTGIDYVAGLRIHAVTHTRARNRWLLVSLIANLGILGVFKYYGFFVDSFVDLLQAVGISARERTLELVLPLGISFYTFQSMSYSIDIYRGHLRPTRSLLDFSTFVAFFPQLVAGPIVRARDFLPQLEVRHRLSAEDVQAGVDRILAGLVKKAVLADNLAPFVDHVFAAPGGVGAAQAWAALLAFYGQIYWDFSAYSDIAIGSARLFGFRLRENFNHPYLSASPQEFWRRWHVSLSTWLRDYLYIPLKGSRGTRAVLYRNLMLTMLLGGLWHGAAWTFVLWGAYHGALLCLHRLRRDRGQALPAAVAWPLCLVATLIGWLIFRADSVDAVLALGSQLVAFGNLELSPAGAAAVGYCLAGVIAERAGPRLRALCNSPSTLAPMLRGTAWAGALQLLLVATPPDLQSFIYFVF